MARVLGQADYKMNQVVGDINSIYMLVGRKRPVCPFTRNEFCKFIGCIILEVTFGIKGHQLWGKPEISVSKKG